MSNILHFPDGGERESARLQVIEAGADIADFMPEMGTADEWLGTAITHMKICLPCGNSAGTVTISAAALSLLVLKLEELIHDGPKVAIPFDRD